MIDITKVQAYDIPPEIIELQSKNVELINENNLFKKQSYMAFSILAIIIIVGLTAIYQTNNKNDER